ncbi:hypothetical protein JL108_05145 [Aeromicrobium sp. YIM 150415]|uniref:DUF6318 family protein n=1 Tax=Aeromicrobium sp. YIM 150415 TaxID=2803912 RepID=UPI001964FC52|nr:DUF6318 family protein [Aeromicrobium sp. YIM 150415]MBM9462826.1 hypothetical protein [Aeromicrobium sp. YIM 150415]
MVLPVLAMTLMGCSGDPDPPEESVSPSPEITAPAMPELAGDDSPAGAEAFARHYIEVLNYASSTGDTDLLRSLSSADCSGCQKYVDLYRSTYDDGGYFRESKFVIDATTIDYEEGYSKQYVTLQTTLTEGQHRTSADSAPRTTSATKDTISFELSYHQDWVVTQFGLGETK